MCEDGPSGTLLVYGHCSTRRSQNVKLKTGPRCQGLCQVWQVRERRWVQAASRSKAQWRLSRTKMTKQEMPRNSAFAKCNPWTRPRTRRKTTFHRQFITIDSNFDLFWRFQLLVTSWISLWKYRHTIDLCLSNRYKIVTYLTQAIV